MVALKGVDVSYEGDTPVQGVSRDYGQASTLGRDPGFQEQAYRRCVHVGRCVLLFTSNPVTLPTRKETIFFGRAGLNLCVSFPPFPSRSLARSLFLVLERTSLCLTLARR